MKVPHDKSVIAIIAFDILLPLTIGIAVWHILREPVDVLLITLIVTILVIAVQIYAHLLQNRTDEPLFLAAATLQEHIRILWNRNNYRLFRILLKDKISKMTNDLGSTSFYCTNDDIEHVSLRLINRFKKDAFLTFLATFQHDWNRANKYIDATRKVAAKGDRQITRVFICNSDDLKDPSLLKFMSEDSNAQINTLLVLTEDVNRSEREILTDFGIWDDEVLCLVAREASQREVVKCEYTTDETQLAIAMRRKNQLLKYAIHPKDHLRCYIPTDLTETFSEIQSSAPLIEKLSENCSSLALGGQSCSWYHGAWQYLRLLDLVASPDWHKQFYQDKLSETLLTLDRQKKVPRILISGAAEYGMLSHVTQALRSNPWINANITVIDMCETPLKACKVYAENHNIKITTICDNVLNINPYNSYDCIVTDEFLTVVNPQMRQLVVDQWKLLLSPGGVVITTAMIRNDELPTEEQTLINERIAYEERCQIEAVERASLVWNKLAKDEIMAIARAYAANMTNYYIRDEDEIRSLFKDYTIKNLTEKLTPGEFFQPTYSFEIVAAKPI